MKVHLPSSPPTPTVIVDTREQLPLEFTLPTVSETLVTGDYSLVGLEDQVCVERKSLPDLLGCCGRDRERFERELDRMRAFPNRLLVIEASWADLARGDWRSSLSPIQVSASLMGWMADGIPVTVPGGRNAAAKLTERFLRICHGRAWGRLRSLAKTHQEQESLAASHT